jgi:hypothetical protein
MVRDLTCATLLPLIDRDLMKSNKGSWHSLRLQGREGQKFISRLMFKVGAELKKEIQG